jgi:hypothetical protein
VAEAGTRLAVKVALPVPSTSTGFVAPVRSAAAASVHEDPPSLKPTLPSVTAELSLFLTVAVNVTAFP